MKTVRDLQRIFASINDLQAAKSGAGAPHGSAKVDTWHETVSDIIYVLFLSYESALNAIADLIEFQPTRDENIIVILMTELVCFSFLCEYLKDYSLRFMRLQLRKSSYEKVYGELLNLPFFSIISTLLEYIAIYYHLIQKFSPLFLYLALRMVI